MEVLEKRADLKILSASAGSGKTFSLVQEFLKLTLTSGERGSFSKIIAMTFTNKASLEMKERVIEALDLLAHENSSDIKKRKSLLSITQENTKLKASEIVTKAKSVLKEILHHYEDFSVLTIDKFSLRLIRTFARDLDIQQDFKVVLEETQLLEQVIDELLSKVGTDDNKRLSSLAVRYAKSNLEEGVKWDFRQSLLDFSKVLIKESNQDFVTKVLEKEYSSEEFEEIKSKLKTIKSRYDKLIEDYLADFEKHQLQKGDLPGRGLLDFPTKIKKNIGNSPQHIVFTNTIIGTLDGSKLTDKHNLPEQLKNDTNQLLIEGNRLADDYYCYNLLRKNFYNLALLKYVGEQLQTIRKNESIIRISEFNSMISELISKENAAYIYERLGTKFSHYLLDEFQDTSRLQWLNLIPLLHDSISQGKFNLIVGDPKQAIYRFRNGLVEQFIQLPSIFNPTNDPEISLISSQFENQGSKEPLEANWRSHKKIVEFNNLFFPDFIAPLSEEIKMAYADVQQVPKGEDGGYVEFKYYPESSKKSDYQEIELSNIYEWIKECEKDGFNRGDICLLARGKKDGQRWAQFLTKQKEAYKVVSADSLAIGADKTIQLFIDYLNLRRNFNNPTKQTQFAVSYFVRQHKDPLLELENYWDGKVGKLKIDHFIKDYFDNKETLIFNYDNLYDLGQQFSRLFGVSELTNPYLHHLMEMLQEYDLNDGPDIKGFLDYWNAKGKTETVQIPENDDAIKIMTAHKSKGLEFPIVILPNLGWEIKLRDEYFIEKDNEIYFTRLKKKDAPDFVINEHEEEYQKQLMDEFNLLYVAMTRPVQRLYGALKKNNSNTLDTFIYNQLININSTELHQREKDGFEIFSFGKASPKLDTRKKGSDAFLPIELNDFLWFPEISLQDKEALSEEDLSRERRYGSQLHYLLSKVETKKDLAPQIQALKIQGKLENDMLKDLERDTSQALENREYIQLMNRAQKVLNEQEIILDVDDVKRPDKLILTKDGVVLVDFKTGKKQKKDEDQVRNYAFALRELGFAVVEGYLFYLRENEVVKVC